MQPNVCTPFCNIWDAEFAVLENVTPAKAGVQVGSRKKLDTGSRRYDGHFC